MYKNQRILNQNYITLKLIRIKKKIKIGVIKCEKNIYPKSDS